MRGQIYSSATTTVPGLVAGPATVTLRWTISNGTCTASSDDVVLRNDVQPVANAGSGGSVCGIGVGNPFTFTGVVPGVGTGTWSQTSGAGIASYGNANVATTTVSVDTYGTYVFRWTVVNLTCSSFAEITVNFYQSPTTANAGTDIFQCNNSSFTLSGNSAVVGAGTWSQVGGPAVVIGNVNNATTTVTGLVAGPATVTLRWTISNGTCTASSDDVVLRNDVQPVANAGTGGSVCGIGVGNPFTFTGVVPGVGTGTWSKTSGAGIATYGNANVATTTVSVDTYGTYVFRWTVVNLTCSSFAEITVNFYQSPTTANAGTDIFQCNNSSFTLSGNSAVVGAGTWSQVGGPAVVIGNVNNATTTVTGLVAGPATVTLRWTISNGTCTASSDDVVLRNDVQPVANAGTGGSVCGIGVGNPFTFTGVVPGVGTGTWSQTSGAGIATYGNANVATTTVSVDTYGTYVFRWTVVNLTCSSFAEITVNFYQSPTTANAGTDIFQCNNSSFTLSGNSAVVGAGTWSQVGGPAVVIGNVNNATTTVTGLVAGPATVTLRWTISNGTCTASSDDVVLRNDVQPVANAGTGGSVCGIGVGNPFTFTGVVPGVGTGTWSQTSGAGIATYGNANVATTTVSVDTYGTYVLRWTVVNLTCSSFAEVTVNFYQAPTTANAGTDIFQCNNSTFTLSGNSAVVGTGLWSYVSGFAGVTITSASNATSTVTGLPAGSTVTLQWTISNGTCTASSDNVVLRNDVQPVANAGVGGNVCGIGVGNPFTFTGV